MSAADSTSSVFTDFCQAWGARFPGSQLPDAWEEDVRANLKKHTTKVTILREELEKEEMYVDYLETLLKDIERKKTSVTRHQECSPAPARVIHPDDVDVNKQAFLDSHLNELQKTDAFITVINVSSNEEHTTNTAEPITNTTSNSTKQKPLKKSSEVTTVAASEYVNVTLSKSRDSIRSVSSPTTPPTSPLISSTEDFNLVGREGLAAVNTSSISSSSDSTSSSSKDQPLADDDLEDDLNNSTQEDEGHRGQPDGRDFEEENNHLKTSSTPAPILRGNSAGNLESGEGHHHQAASRVSSVSQLRANWEGRPPVMLKPMAKSRSKLPLPQEAAVVQASQPQQQHHHRDPPGRKDSDSSSRGRMGSPSGKSHDSSDSEHSWSRQDSGSRKQQQQQRNSTTNSRSGASEQRNTSGAERLDRLVRKTSSSGSGNKKKPPQIQPRDPNRIISSSSSNSNSNTTTTINGDEPLYDTVAADEIEDEYDNHLLAYSSEKSSTLASGKTDTIGSGGNSSSTDLGFDEPPMPPSRRGTLSSSDATISSFNKQSASEPEEDYVNLQYFLQQHHHRRRANTGSTEDSQINLIPDSPLPTMTPPVMFQSDDELDILDDDEEPPVVAAPPEKPRVHKRQVTDELPKTPDVPVEDQGRHDLGMVFNIHKF